MSPPELEAEVEEWLVGFRSGALAIARTLTLTPTLTPTPTPTLTPTLTRRVGGAHAGVARRVRLGRRRQPGGAAQAADRGGRSHVGRD
eukprot:scaffold34706_cov57-Phaeocystis_antarctica.AAC.1